MRRTAVAVIFVLIAVSLRATAAPQGADLSNVQIKTNKIAPNFYTLEGQGGTMGALVGPDGVFVVDSQFAPLTEKLVAAIRGISTTPIRFLVDTHVHADHTGGNENFAKLGVTILAREKLRARLAQPPAGANNAGQRGAPPAALPTLTYDAPLTFYMNGEEVHAIPVPVAHTDGDTMVWFPKSDVLMTGDFFRSLGYPNIDIANGGSLKGMLEGLQAIVNLVGPNTKVVPGHGEIVGRAAVAAHRDMIISIRDRIGRLVQQGMTLEQVVAAKPTAEYDARVPNAAMTSERFIGQLYSELRANR